MDDFADLTPPPARSLTAEQRARLRSRLPFDHPEERSRSWLLIGAAAAATVLVVVGGAIALSRAGGGNGTSPRVLQPASQGASVPPATTPRGQCPTDPSGLGAGSIVTRQRKIDAVTQAVGSGCPPLEATVQPTCASAVDEQLPGAHQVAENDGVTFWQAGERWVLCYAGPVATTVHHVGRLTGPTADLVRFAFSTDIGDTVDGRSPTTFVAGGPLGGGDARITYTFPDGHRQDASYVDGAGGTRWWEVRYVARDGVLADPSTHWDRLAPVVVRLYGTDVSPPDRFEIPFSTGGCAQANHGC